MRKRLNGSVLPCFTSTTYADLSFFPLLFNFYFYFSPAYRLEVLRALVGHIPPHPLWAELLWQRQEEMSKRTTAFQQQQVPQSSQSPSQSPFRSRRETLK